MICKKLILPLPKARINNSCLLSFLVRRTSLLKISGSLILSIAVTACTTQTSRVDIANQLYKGCYQGTIQAKPVDINTLTTQEITNIVDGIDQLCLAWTLAWYPALTGDQITKMTPIELNKFDSFRARILNQVLEEFSDLLPDNRKKQKK